MTCRDCSFSSSHAAAIASLLYVAIIDFSTLFWRHNINSFWPRVDGRIWIKFFLFSFKQSAVPLTQPRSYLVRLLLKWIKIRFSFYKKDFMPAPCAHTHIRLILSNSISDARYFLLVLTIIKATTTAGRWWWQNKYAERESRSCAIEYYGDIGHNIICTH